MHFGANSVYAFAPQSAHYEKIVTVYQNVGLQAFMAEMARRSRASEKSSRLQDLDVMFPPPLSSIKGPVHRCFPHTLAFGSSFGKRTYASRTASALTWARLTSATRKTSSGHATLSRTRRVSYRGVAEKIGSTPLWRTSVHTRRER